uniref:Uncharacterized protein n=1 Tax=Glossina palpalis gambiensis TaxID=67801 RepID=A0A1B0B2R6_9MUSC
MSLNYYLKRANFEGIFTKIGKCSVKYQKPDIEIGYHLADFNAGSEVIAYNIIFNIAIVIVMVTTATATAAVTEC